MTCEAYKIIFHQYMEGVLEQKALEDFQQHIESCSKCRVEQREFSRMQGIVKDAMNPSIDYEQKISQVIANIDIRPQKPPLSPAALISCLKYSVAAAVFLVIGVYVGSRYLPNFMILQKPLSIAVSQLQGEVLIRHAWEDDWKILTAEESIYEGDAFLALDQSSLILSLAENKTVSLSENSSVNLLEYNGQTEFGIRYGTIKAKLDGPHGPFFISTPNGRVEALGTAFTITVE